MRGVSGPHSATFLHGPPGYSPQLPLERKNVPPCEAALVSARGAMIDDTAASATPDGEL